MIVIPGPVAHIDRFGYRDLHMFYVVAIPDRLENGVGKTEKEDILGRFFAKIVIDAVHLPFFEDAVDQPVKLLSRRQIAPKGFFYNDAPPPVLFIHHAMLPQLLHYGHVQVWSDGQVIQAVGNILFFLAEKCLQREVIVVDLGISGVVPDVLGESEPRNPGRSSRSHIPERLRAGDRGKPRA